MINDDWSLTSQLEHFLITAHSIKTRLYLNHANKKNPKNNPVWYFPVSVAGVYCTLLRSTVPLVSVRLFVDCPLLKKRGL